MTEVGEVIEVKGAAARVRFERKETCGKCGMCMFKRDSAYIDMNVENVLNAEPGDRAEVELSDGIVIYAALIVYLLPLLFAAAGLGIGLLLKNEILQLFLCLGFLVLGYIIIIVVDKKWKMTRKTVPVMTRLIEKSEEMNENG